MDLAARYELQNVSFTAGWTRPRSPTPGSRRLLGVNQIPIRADHAGAGHAARRSVLDSAEFAGRVGEDGAATYRALLEYANAATFPTRQRRGNCKRSTRHWPTS